MKISRQVSLHDKNWFKTGGTALFYAEPTGAQECARALDYAREHSLNIFALGEGANVLISDDGFAGLVIAPKLQDITITELSDTHSLVAAGAGVSIPDLITFCLDNNLLGLEEFSGIPGTVGGATYINIHYFEFLLSQFLVSAEVIEKDTGTVHTVDNAWFAFGYDQSTLQKGTHYLLGASFRLRTCSALQAAYAKGRSLEIIRHRTHRYPTKNTCGSFFRNFFDEEVTLEVNGRNMTRVAYYLDVLGLKGKLSVGGAQISQSHANMIVNDGTATTQDIVALARIMQEKVLEHFGILPEPECQLIGFTQYPLLLTNAASESMVGALSSTVRPE